MSEDFNETDSDDEVNIWLILVECFGRGQHNQLSFSRPNFVFSCEKHLHAATSSPA